MKVLFNTSQNAFRNLGGGEVQLLETKKQLEKLGVKVELYTGRQEISDFDLLHNFNIHRDTFATVQKALDAKVPVAISTIYWPSLKSALLWNNGFAKKAKAMAVELINRLDFFGFSSVKKTLKKADVLLPNSVAEAEKISNIFGIPMEKIVPIANGVDERFANAVPDEFQKKFGLKDFVLYVGRIEERKNVMALVKAMNGLEDKLVIIGNAKSGSGKYFAECKKIAGRNIVFLDAVPHDSELLESAYAACKVFALPSWYETPGLAALEAGLAGANIVVTKEGCTKEYFAEFASYADPASVPDIRKKILLELRKPKGDALKTRIMKNFLWRHSAMQTKAAYEKALDAGFEGAGIQKASEKVL